MKDDTANGRVEMDKKSGGKPHPNRCLGTQELSVLRLAEGRGFVLTTQHL